ncbi:hypothetical protein ABK040_000740 [Willaertia magna]
MNRHPFSQNPEDKPAEERLKPFTGVGHTLEGKVVNQEEKVEHVPQHKEGIDVKQKEINRSTSYSVKY